MKDFRKLFVQISSEQKWTDSHQVEVLLEIVEDLEEQNRVLHKAAPNMACDCMEELVKGLKEQTYFTAHPHAFPMPIPHEAKK